jgi:hypothetical protein
MQWLVEQNWEAFEVQFKALGRVFRGSPSGTPYFFAAFFDHMMLFLLRSGGKRDSNGLAEFCLVP